MTVKTAMTALITASVLVAGSQAMAFGGEKRHGGEHGPRMNFEQLDTNSDGKLSKEELAAAGKGRFESQDANSDGKITKDEVAASASERAVKRFDRMIEQFDTDKDGALSQDEIKQGKHAVRMDKMFDRMDADGDGFVSQAELKDMRGKGHKRMKN